jgi:hypothetical protein
MGVWCIRPRTHGWICRAPVDFPHSEGQNTTLLDRGRVGINILPVADSEEQVSNASSGVRVSVGSQISGTL